jgi:hypothetical protein
MTDPYTRADLITEAALQHKPATEIRQRAYVVTHGPDLLGVRLDEAEARRLAEEHLRESTSLRGVALGWSARSADESHVVELYGATLLGQVIEPPYTVAPVDLLAEVGRLQTRVADLERERDELNAMIRSSNTAAVTARRELEQRPDRATVLREAVDEVTASCPEHGPREEAWMDCHCEVADLLREMAGAAEGGEGCG